MITNCTICDNTASTFGGGIYSLNLPHPSALNCIIWGNSAPDGAQIYFFPGSGFDATYSNIQDTLWPGDGNINQDPLFVSGYFLSQTAAGQAFQSPCVDAGDTSSVMIEGTTRTDSIYDAGIVDMGYHYSPCSLRYLQVISPNGGEEWVIFDTVDVQWIGVGFTGSVKIELNRNYPGGSWEVLEANTENDSTEEIAVTAPLSDSCRIRISTVLDTLTDVSDDNFSIISSLGYLSLVPVSQPDTTMIEWDAGVMECPDSTSETFYFKNIGNQAIVVFAPENAAGPEFTSQHNCPSYFALVPEEISTCSLVVWYNPTTNGIHRDTIQVQTNAANAQPNGFVYFPLTGQRITTPLPPDNLVISQEGYDARLTWSPVTESIGACPVTVTTYLIFYSPTLE